MTSHSDTPSLTGTVGLMSGPRLDIFRPDPLLLQIDQIANSLGNLCRFGGQVWHFYSVAEHCCHVSSLFDLKTQPELALAGLLHDAAEAYLGDVITPIKNLLPEYQQVEAEFHSVIFKKYGLTMGHMEKIIWADKAAVVIEARQLTSGEWTEGLYVNPEHWFKVESWNPDFAKARYLERYWEIINTQNTNNVVRTDGEY